MTDFIVEVILRTSDVDELTCGDRLDRLVWYPLKYLDLQCVLQIPQDFTTNEVLLNHSHFCHVRNTKSIYIQQCLTNSSVIITRHFFLSVILVKDSLIHQGGLPHCSSKLVNTGKALGFGYIN